ncbi:MAG: DUF2461 domain-containing protein [Nocardioides sp.]
MTFAGFPIAALDFYEDLELDNTKSFWEARKQVYLDAVKTPMTALCAELAGEFGAAKVFRPHRDVRFGKDKTPYKTGQGAYVPTGPSTGYYVEVSARGVRVGGGCYETSGARLAAIREGIADDRAGARLDRRLAKARRQGWELGGNRLKTAPRGYPIDHPRIELLRHRSLVLTKQYGFDPVIHTAGLSELVRADWRQLDPVLGWLGEHEESG